MVRLTTRDDRGIQRIASLIVNGKLFHIYWWETLLVMLEVEPKAMSFSLYGVNYEEGT